MADQEAWLPSGDSQVHPCCLCLCLPGQTPLCCALTPRAVLHPQDTTPFLRSTMGVSRGISVATRAAGGWRGSPHPWGSLQGAGRAGAGAEFAALLFFFSSFCPLHCAGSQWGRRARGTSPRGLCPAFTWAKGGPALGLALRGLGRDGAGCRIPSDHEVSGFAAAVPPWSAARRGRTAGEPCLLSRQMGVRGRESCFPLLLFIFQSRL